MKVFIAIPCLDQLSARFVSCLINLIQAPREYEVETAFHLGTLVYDSRNALAEKVINSNADYVLWLDSDMTFMPDTLDMLLELINSTGYDMVTGMYYRRRPPWTPTLFTELDITGHGNKVTNIVEDEMPNEPFEVEGCGFGCILMRRNVLWNVLCHFGLMFSPTDGVGEDLSFCWRARKCGHKILCDPTIALGHEVRTVITKGNRGDFR